MEPVYYTVTSINGDYAYMTSDSGDANQVAMFLLPDGAVCPVADAALQVLERMEAFYRDFPEDLREVLAFQRAKFEDAENRYAWKIRRAYGGGFVKKGMELARQRQEEADV